MVSVITAPRYSTFPMMPQSVEHKLMVSVITAPRYTDALYLPQTLAELSKQLRPESLALVTADAYKPEIPPGWGLQWRPGPERRGSRLQMRAVFEAFIKSDAPRLLYCEDDIIPCRNLIEYARRIEIPEKWPLVSFFDPRIGEEWQGARIVAPLPTRRFLYTQCFVIERRTVEKVLAFDFTEQPKRIRGPNGSDSMLRGFFQRLGYKAYGAQVPNLVTHVGDDSIVCKGTTRVRGATKSPADFDCLSLIQPSNRRTGPSQ